jgi:hypothetical protein
MVLSGVGIEMDQQTKIGIGAASGIALMALLEPHFFESQFLFTVLIYGALIGLMFWGFWPVGAAAIRKMRGGYKKMWPQYLMLLALFLFCVGLAGFLRLNVTPPAVGKDSAAPPRHTNGLRVGTILFYIGGDDQGIIPVIHALTFIQADGSKLINDMYATLDCKTGSQDFRLWITRDFTSSKTAHAVRMTTLRVPEAGINQWNYFYISDPKVQASYRLLPGDYKLSIRASDEDGKELIIKDGISFSMTEENIAAIAGNNGLYFDWDSSRQIYVTRPSLHQQN